MLNIEIRLVDENDDETTDEIMAAPTKADSEEHAKKLAQQTAEEQKAIVRLFVVGGDDHFHEPIQDGDFYPVKFWVDEAIKSLPEKSDLVYVDYRDQLREDQISAILEGDMDKAIDSFMEEWISDQQHSSIMELLKDNLPDEAKEHFDEVVSSDEFERFQSECWERDSSTPFDDLARNTPGVMIRYYLDHDVPDYTMVDTPDEFEEAAREIAKAAGIDYKTNEKNIKSLIANASYGGSLVVLHRSDIEDVMKVMDGGTVIFTDPEVLIYDGFNGSGHQESLTGTITVTIDDDHPMMHDTGRMSWSDGIAGIVHSCAETSAEFTPKKKEATA